MKVKANKKLASHKPKRKPLKVKTNLKAGWWTGGGGVRGTMIADLAELIRLRHIKPRTKAFIDQCHTFIRTKKMQDGEARKGTHDDLVMAWAIGTQIRKSMPSGRMRIRTY